MLQHVVFDPTVYTCICILIETYCVSSIIPNTSVYIVMSEKYRLVEIIQNRSTLHARALGPKEIKYRSTSKTIIIVVILSLCSCFVNLL